jgi:hypothetical protein
LTKADRVRPSHEEGCPGTGVNSRGRKRIRSEREIGRRKGVDECSAGDITGECRPTEKRA